jgi:hypothetical protein
MAEANQIINDIRRSKMTMKSSEKASRNQVSRGVFNYSRPRTNSPFPHMREKKGVKGSFLNGGGFVLQNATLDDADIQSKPNAFSQNVSIIENELKNMIPLYQCI